MLRYFSHDLIRNALFFLLSFFCLGIAKADTFSVDNLEDFGPGSMRQALEDANAHPGPDQIVFNVSGAFYSNYFLPIITDSLSIDGTTAPGYASGAPSFALSGLAALNAQNPGMLSIRGLKWEFVYAIVVNADFGQVNISECVFSNCDNALLCTGDAAWNIHSNDFRTSPVGISLYNVHSGLLSAFNNQFGGDAWGFYLENCSNLSFGGAAASPAPNVRLLDGDGITDLSQGVVKTMNCSDILFEALNLSYSGATPQGSGLSMYISGGNMTVRNCNVQNRGSALFCWGDANWMVTGNDLRYANFALAFAYMVNGTVSASDNLFAGNYNQKGLRLVGCSGISVGDETVSPTPDILIKSTDGMTDLPNQLIDALNCSDLSFDHLIMNNTRPYLWGSGIFVQNASGSIAIRNCQFRKRDSGLSLGGDASWTVLNNDLTDCEISLSFSDVPSGAIQASGNLLTNATGTFAGLYLYRCAGVSIGDENAVPAVDIVIKDSDGLKTRYDAIETVLCSDMVYDGLDLSYNTISNNGVAITASGASGGLIIRNCTINNRFYGLFVNGSSQSASITCNVFQHNYIGIGIDGTHPDNLITNNVLEDNNTSIFQSGNSAMLARLNYWGGAPPQLGHYNGYAGNVIAIPFLQTPAACTPFSCTDTDADGVCDAEDNCKNSPNHDQTDGDCDGYGDFCDVCPSGDDRIDNNHDGLPDCNQLLDYNAYIDSWKCGPNKIFVCHSGKSLCINKNALQAHFAHGDKVGPCSNCAVANFRSDEASIDESADPGFELSPNPAEDQVLVSFPDIKNVKLLQVSNLYGDAVFQLPLEKDQDEALIDLNSRQLPSGVYLVTVVADGQRSSRRLVVVR